MKVSQEYVGNECIRVEVKDGDKVVVVVVKNVDGTITVLRES